MSNRSRDERAVASIDAEGDKGVLTKFVLMGKPKPETSEREPEANIEWVLKPMVARRGRGRSQAPPSIGSMQVPGKKP